ncbi:glycosyltransferase [Vibrio sp. Vb2354]|uniref:glycosyltransferase n=1 Tax=unclassified Vibrio TaxID=2614977 RepID=UPI002963C8A8|nr:MULTISPECIES: glycosyltransferase [unclassified Vibrio]MDW1737808.1 glycosyltransferase [Vibrio sp. Vb2321]MDW1756936.1 glycosyltransferase [Vibrio sp. Vb2353]MDW1771239.1 glycosyltransferase [Vibrio sp. Vb2354]MDW1807563.1 glycosyltransferase [Vibrio sp. Vb2362]
MKKISVLMSLYDKESAEFLNLCLGSLVDQTRQADEVVIVFDGPINNSLESLVDFFSVTLPIVKVKLANNQGLAAALNAGLEKCTGDLVARMDTDDICLNERLEKQEKYLLEHDLDIVGTAASVIDFQGNFTGVRVNPCEHEEIIQSLWCNPFIHPSVMFKKASLISIGGYDDSLRRRQDYELWFRAAKNGLRLGNLEDKLLKYRFDQHTLKKQSPKLAWMQGKIGFSGSMACKLGIVKSLVCFIPFIRSLLPVWFQFKLTKLMKSLDTRTR